MHQVFALRPFQVEPVTLNGINVLRPGVDERHICPMAAKMSSDVAADRASSHEREFLPHTSPSLRENAESRVLSVEISAIIKSASSLQRWSATPLERARMMLTQHSSLSPQHSALPFGRGHYRKPCHERKASRRTMARSGIQCNCK